MIIFLLQIIDNMFRIPHIKEMLNTLNQNASNATRDLLCKKITAHLLEQKAANINTTDFHKIVETIVKHCPSEKSDFYFQDGKIKKGKLYYRYRNHKTNLRQVGLLQSAKHLNQKSKLSNIVDELAESSFLKSIINDISF